MREDEEARLKETIKRLRDEIQQLKEEHEKSPGFAEYVEKSMRMANVPTDPYAHQYQLLNQPGHKIKNYEDLLDPSILLGNIADNKSMLLMQRDYYFLNRFFDMGKRSSGIESLFQVFYYTWVGQCRMTSALQGNERNLQSFLEPELPQASGFGFPFGKKNKQKKQRKKRVADYLTPDEGGGMY